MNISFYKLFTLVSMFSTKIASSELPSSGTVIKSDSNSCNKFTQDLIRKKSCFGACTGEEDAGALSRIHGAECLLCAGTCFCAAAGYGVVACAADSSSAYALGATSGCGASVALTITTNNNPRCGLYQSESSLTAKDEEEKFVRIFAKRYPQLAQQEMQIAPSPIELNTNPMLK